MAAKVCRSRDPSSLLQSCLRPCRHATACCWNSSAWAVGGHMSGNLAGACSPCSWPKARSQGKQEIEAGWTSGHGGWARGTVQLEAPQRLGGLERTKPSCPLLLAPNKDFQSHREAWARKALLDAVNKASFSMHKRRTVAGPRLTELTEKVSLGWHGHLKWVQKRRQKTWNVETQCF